MIFHANKKVKTVKIDDFFQKSLLKCTPKVPVLRILPKQKIIWVS